MVFNGDVTNNIRSGDVGMYGPPKNDGCNRINDEPLDFNITNWVWGRNVRNKWTQDWLIIFSLKLSIWGILILTHGWI